MNRRLVQVIRSENSYRNCSIQKKEKRVADFPLSYIRDGVEKHWNQVWNEKKYFLESEVPTFKMIMPPPNITGVLHLGHALTVTIQDVLTRWHKMKGSSVIWVPGLDHAGIATQAAVEKYLFATKKISKNDLRREEFLVAVKEWTTQKGDVIKNQLKSLGASVDWSKEYFTMSKVHNDAVNEAFLILNERGLLYRKKDLVNWSPALRSTISDIEVDIVEIHKKTDLSIPGYKSKISFGEIYEVAFKIRDSKEEILVSTTRVELMFGDTAIAVNSEDSRYAHHIGKQVYHPLRSTFIPVIGDSAVKMDFGTGALKITPAHDRTDLEIARRHNLDIVKVINEEGLMNENAKKFVRLPRFEARRQILNELANLGVLRKINDHSMTLPICSRSGDVIENLIKEQWFLQTEKLAKKASEAVRQNFLRINPPKFEQQWFDKLDNIRDWCVSRQLFWGHRIPAYKCQNGTETKWIISSCLEDAEKESMKKFGADFEVKQDSDVLDTWFSAGLLPLSAMGWPRESPKNYPLSLMETGHDILFYWVARMVMLCTEISGNLPFDEVLLHGVLCDAQGKKMSKSLGNVINPEYVINGITLENLNNQAHRSFQCGLLSGAELKRTLSINSKMFPEGIPECGVDALRLTLCAHDIKAERISFNAIECKIAKHFCNKIWQACRYVILVTDENEIEEPEKFTDVDRWIRSRMILMVNSVNKHFEARNFHLAVLAIKQFFYYEFCDFYLEATKLGLKSGDEEIMQGHKSTLVKCLEVSLRIIAPIMPYLSEDLYSRMKTKVHGFSSIPSLMEATYPTSTEIGYRRDEKIEKEFEAITGIILSIRKALGHINRNTISEIHIVLKNGVNHEVYARNSNFIIATAKIKSLKTFRTNEYVENENSICSCDKDFRVYYVLMDDSDASLVKARVFHKRLEVEKKLGELLEEVSTPIYLRNTSKRNELKNEMRVKDLQKKLEKYPKFA